MPGLEFEGIIDTGFSGFLHIPFNHAFSLRLPLEGTVTSVLADGSKVANITALAQTTFGGKTVVGAVALAPSSQDILVGMDFLRRFKLGLVMVSNLILLVDEDEIEQIRKRHETADPGEAQSNEAAQKNERGDGLESEVLPPPHSTSPPSES